VANRLALNVKVRSCRYGIAGISDAIGASKRHPDQLINQIDKFIDSHRRSR